MKRFACVVIVILAGMLIGCASAPTVDMKEPRRVVGTENDVRIDAEIYGDSVVSGGTIALRYAVTNSRNDTIAVADLIPETTYDSDTQTVTVNIGTEIPGEQFLPRLLLIKPGEKRSFATSTRLMLLNIHNPLDRMAVPRALRLKLNFLNETRPFTKLIEIPEKAVHDPKLAADLFPIWVDRNETVITGSLPIRWAGERMDSSETDTSEAVGGRRRVPKPPGVP